MSQIFSRFSSKITLASNRQSKDITLSMSEALDLNQAIIVLMNDYQESLKQIANLQNQMLQPTQISMDGGSFK